MYNYYSDLKKRKELEDKILLEEKEKMMKEKRKCIIII